MFGKTKMLNDKTIALDVLGGAIAAANALCLSTNAADNPDLKRLYKEFLQDALMAVDTIEVYASDQGFIKQFATPDEQLSLALEHADEIVAVQA